jgi:hypothetical protein
MPDDEQAAASDETSTETSQEPETKYPEKIEVLNQATREPETLLFVDGPGENITVHHGDYVMVISYEHFQEVVDWFGEQI